MHQAARAAHALSLQPVLLVCRTCSGSLGPPRQWSERLLVAFGKQQHNHLVSHGRALQMLFSGVAPWPARVHVCVFMCMFVCVCVMMRSARDKVNMESRVHGAPHSDGRIIQTVPGSGRIQGTRRAALERQDNTTVSGSGRIQGTRSAALERQDGRISRRDVETPLHFYERAWLSWRWRWRWWWSWRGWWVRAEAFWARGSTTLTFPPIYVVTLVPSVSGRNVQCEPV
jgi:hypothetical protein